MSSTEGMGLLVHELDSELKGFSNVPWTESSRNNLKEGVGPSVGMFQ